MMHGLTLLRLSDNFVKRGVSEDLWSLVSAARMLVGLKRLKKKQYVATAYKWFCNSSGRILDLVLSQSLPIM